MVYHRIMVRLLNHPLRLSLWLLCIALLLSACAPTGPLQRSDRDLSDATEDQARKQPERRLAVSISDQADATLRSLRRAMQDGSLSAAEALDRLTPFTINELRWQRRQYEQQPDIYAWIDLALQVQIHKLDPGGLSTALTDWRRRSAPILARAPIHTEDAITWADNWRSQRHGPQRIGIIFPGESSLSMPGEMIKLGLMDAWLSQPPEQRARIYFYYADDAQISSLYQALEQANADGVDWLVGPLPREQVEHVLLNRSARWMIPTLFLNTPRPKEALKALGGQRLAFALNPEEEATQAAVLADGLGFDRALLLAQDSTWGDRMAATFKETFGSLGGSIVQADRYDASRVDHSALLESVLGLTASQARIDEIQSIIGERMDAEPQRRGDIDMIFLASRASDARQIRPQLQFFRAEDLPVVVTSQAIEGAVDGRRDVDLEGVYLPMAPWFINSTEPGARRLQAQGRHPELNTPTWSSLYAMGQDLAMILRWLEPLRKDADLVVNGHTGDLSINAHGQVQRQLMSVRVRNGQAQVIDPLSLQ